MKPSQRTSMAHQRWINLLLAYAVVLQQAHCIHRSSFSYDRRRVTSFVSSDKPPSRRRHQSVPSIPTEALQPILSPIVLQIRGGSTNQGLVHSILEKTKGMGILHNLLRSVCQNIFGMDVSWLMESEVKQKSGKKKKKRSAVHKETSDSSGKRTTRSTTSATKKKASVKTKTTTDAASVTLKEMGTTTKKQQSSKAASKLTNQHLKTTLKSTNPNYRIQQELKNFLKDPPEHLSVKVGKNIRVWIVQMQGVGIYEGEQFKLRISFPANYPTVPPSVYFIGDSIPTHEHVYTNGDICLSLLGKDWRPTMTAQSIAHSILSILGSAHSKSLPMDNAKHAQNKPGQYQQDWVYHDDCK